MSDTKSLTPDDYINRFYSSREPEPEVDQAKLDRLQKMGRLNQIGRSIGLLSDIAGVAMGSNVKKRTPDQTAPYLYSSYQNTLDKYKADSDLWKGRNYAKDIQNIQLGLSNAYRKEDKAYQQKLHEDQLKAQAAKNEQDWQKFLVGAKQKQDQLENTKNYQAGMLGVQQERNDISREKAEKEASGTKEKPYMQVNYRGINTDLKEGDYRRLYEEAKNDPEFSKSDFKTLIDQFQNQPEQAVKHIVQRYWTVKKDREALQQMNSDSFKSGEKQALENQRSARGISTPATPVKQSAIEVKQAKSKWSSYARTSN